MNHPILLAQISPITNPVITNIAQRTPDEAPVVFAKFFAALVGLLLTGATLFALIQLFIGALQWIASSGDKTALENARERIIQAIVGLVITFAVWSIYLIILQFLGISPIGTGGSFNIVIPSLL
ncbi:hypothetical protein HYW55_05875 [Candidatus Gottesmanbacteria bacterium]|nr:hypothetical protein [Candidatus Gottesmanbacteria bacterium]